MTVPIEIEEKDRCLGCLVGLAVGDALGTTLEFRSPGTFEPISDLVGGGPFGLDAGQWTDDTSMALCLAASLVDSNGFDPKDQMERYCRWWQDGYQSSTGDCFDIGRTVRSALKWFLHDGNPIAGSKDRYSAGNGSLMRLAPVPVFYRQNPEQAIALSGDSSKTTHGAAAAVDACRYFGGLLVSALKGEPKTLVLDWRHSPAGPGRWQPDELEPEILEIADGSYREKEPPQIRGTGYVVEALEAALWAFWKTENFRDGALLAVNLGDDADTTGAIYGQIAGAHYGLSGIPEDWLSKLAKRGEILELAEGLFEGPQ